MKDDEEEFLHDSGFLADDFDREPERAGFVSRRLARPVPAPFRNR
jgi:hypothetical protein